jgi:hypothetical protein
MKNLILLESTGTYLSKKTLLTYPHTKVGGMIDYSEGIHLDFVCDEWIDSLSKKDLTTIVRVTKEYHIVRKTLGSRGNAKDAIALFEFYRRQCYEDVGGGRNAMVRTEYREQYRVLEKWLKTSHNFFK